MNGPDETTPYRVLARKYRPSRFADLVGQDAMVRTLTNAIASGRLAHAFILTGIRGIGKTTTARIIARALNCVGPDGKGGPTADPCGVCEHCVAIGEDRHVDVIEMDAASRTGVDDIRDLIEGVLYRPVSARFKVYIIDEVHMLTRNAFNALLKTLEEPPEHVKFIFATTETRKVPVTVLSRCQRFDLRRVDGAVLMDHLRRIAAAERVEIADDALRQIVRAAEGSVRDALSLLDQAIAHADAGPIEAARVRDMLGLADRLRTADLFEALARGRIADALGIFDELFEAGADPSVVLQDLLELAHWLTRIKVLPEGEGAGGAVSDVEIARGREIASALSVPVLTRAWQILLKGLSEARIAEDSRQAAEMILIRLAYAADLPTPAEIVREIATGAAPDPASARTSAPARAPAAAPPPEPARPAEPGPSPLPESFEALVALFGAKKEMILRARLANEVQVVAYAPGRLVFRSASGAAEGLAHEVRRLLQEWTGQSWAVEVDETGEAAPSLREQQEEAAAARRREAVGHPAVQAALRAFPGATVEEIRDVESAAVLGDEPVDPEAEPSNGDPPP